MWPAYREQSAHGRAVLAVAAVLLLVAPAWAQDLSQPLPLAPAIRAGSLPNGLTYYIRPNRLPANRAMLRLVVKAGSVDEADDQRGLAHVLEHMAFNGSTHFKSGELVAYLESIGARFGPHVNAVTEFDQTTFMLDVPTDRPGALARGFEALGDFAGGVSLEPAEIDKERGVVLEEWRGRLGAGTRMQEPQITALFGTSRYATRLPIGTPESIKSFNNERLRDFYRDHYRPERMAVVVAGDVSLMEVEALIKQNFSALKPGGPARQLFQIPEHQETRYVSLSDPEQTSSSVAITIKRPLQTLETAADYRRSLMRLLVFQMINARFGEIARQPDAPFLAASAGSDTLGRTVEAEGFAARVQDGKIPLGLTGLAQEIARVRQHGFGDAELDRAKRAITTAYERAYAERDKAESPGMASELVRYVLTKEAAPGIERELELTKQFLPGITAADLAALAREMFGDANRVVIAIAPEKAGLSRTSEVALREAITTGTTAAVTPWRDEMAARELMPKKPTGGSVRARREISEIGVTVLTLSNGVDVWLKPTDFRNDQIIFTAYAPGGVSLAPPENYTNARVSSTLVALAGVGGFTPVDLGKLLAGKTASAGASIGTYSQGVSGVTSPRDLETALQLASLRFTSPNKDASAFDLLKRQLETQLANQEQSPGFAFGERLGSINTLNHYASRSLTTADVARLDPARMMDFYQQRFANAANFTFFFVGAFKVDEVAPLIATYLGSLPSTGKADARRGDLRLRFPQTVVRETVKKGREPQSQTVITFFADTKLDETEDYRLSAATAVLQARLRDILRESMGGTYSVSVQYGNSAPEPGYGTVTIAFGSSPANVDSLSRAVMAEVDRRRREGPSASDVAAVKAAEKNEVQTALKQNAYWVNSLQAMHQLGRDARKIPQRVDRPDTLTPENLHESFRRHFPADRYTVVSLMPEDTPAAAPAK
jgi:zinc protease